MTGNITKPSYSVNAAGTCMKRRSNGCAKKKPCGKSRKRWKACTEVQRQRFLLFALEGLSYSEIAKRCGCSKGAVQDSIEAVRKKCREFLNSDPTKRDFRAIQ